MSTDKMYIKFGSHVGYFVYGDEHFITLEQIGGSKIEIPKEIFSQVLDEAIIYVPKPMERK